MIQRAERLDGVHVDLMRTIIRAGTRTDFMVTCGLRTIEEQRALLAKGASQTLKSRHLTGHAVDLCIVKNGVATWNFPDYERLAAFVIAAGKELRVPIVWGGSWKSFKDGPHFELPATEYPETVSA